MGFVPTWLRQVSPPASQNHFNHWSGEITNYMGEIAIFDRSRRLSRKRYEIGLLLLRNFNRKSWVANRSVSVSDDLE